MGVYVHVGEHKWVCSSMCAHAEARVFSWGFFLLSPFYLFICLLVYVLRQSRSLNVERPILVRASGQWVLEFLSLHPVSTGVAGTHYPGYWGFRLTFMSVEQTLTHWTVFPVPRSGSYFFIFSFLILHTSPSSFSLPISCPPPFTSQRR